MDISCRLHHLPPNPFCPPLLLTFLVQAALGPCMHIVPFSFLGRPKQVSLHGVVLKAPPGTSVLPKEQLPLQSIPEAFLCSLMFFDQPYSRAPFQWSWDSSVEYGSVLNVCLAMCVLIMNSERSETKKRETRS